MNMKKAFDSGLIPNSKIPIANAEGDVASSCHSNSTYPHCKCSAATQQLINKLYYTHSDSSLEDENEPPPKHPNNKSDTINKKLESYLSSAKYTLIFEAEDIGNSNVNGKESKYN